MGGWCVCFFVQTTRARPVHARAHAPFTLASAAAARRISPRLRRCTKGFSTTNGFGRSATEWLTTKFLTGQSTMAYPCPASGRTLQVEGSALPPVRCIFLPICDPCCLCKPRGGSARLCGCFHCEATFPFRVASRATSEMALHSRVVLCPWHCLYCQPQLRSWCLCLGLESRLSFRRVALQLLLSWGGSTGGVCLDLHPRSMCPAVWNRRWQTRPNRDLWRC